MIWLDDNISLLSGEILKVIGKIDMIWDITGNQLIHSVTKIINSPLEGLKGMNMLEQLTNVTVDFRTGNLIEIPSEKVLHKSNEEFLIRTISAPATSEIVYYASTWHKNKENLLLEPNEQYIQNTDADLF